MSEENTLNHEKEILGLIYDIELQNNIDSKLSEIEFVDLECGCDHEFVLKEYNSQPYGTCLSCGSTVFKN